ncbi:MAG: AraC family transcriptional regulator [Deltaproteobacteria bacterium]|nr:AraC family transcriptional regulator [Deltaproteobacteria bacterium]
MNGLDKYNQNFHDIDGRLIQPDLRIGFVLVPGFTILPLAGFIDTLRHAADESDYSQQVYCKWKILGPSMEPIPSSCGVTIPPWELYGDPTEFDYIVVVGGQTDLIRFVSRQTYEFLRKAEELRIPLVGLCVGVFVLAEAGLLKNQKCAVHPRHLNEFVES